MASSTPHTILLKRNCQGGDPEVLEIVVHTAAVTPGDLLLRSSSGVTPNTNAADTDCEILFAVENPYLDPRVATSPAIDTDYAVAANARCVYPNRGDQVYAWLETSGSVAIGAPLEASNIAGCLQAFTSGRIIAFADEAVTAPGSGPARIKVRVA